MTRILFISVKIQNKFDLLDFERKVLSLNNTYFRYLLSFRVVFHWIIVFLRRPLREAI